MAVSGKSIANGSYGVTVFDKPGYPLAICVCGEFYLKIKEEFQYISWESAEATVRAKNGGRCLGNQVKFRIPDLNEWRLIQKHIEEIEKLMRGVYMSAGLRLNGDTLIGKGMWTTRHDMKCAITFVRGTLDIRLKETLKDDTETLRLIYDICQ